MQTCQVLPWPADEELMTLTDHILNQLPRQYSLSRDRDNNITPSFWPTHCTRMIHSVGAPDDVFHESTA